MASEARESVLSSIRQALKTQAREASMWTEIPRDFRRTTSLSHAGVLQLFIGRLRDYDAEVMTCDQADLGQTIEQMLRARQARTLLVPEGFPPALLPPLLNYVFDRGLTPMQMNECDGVITESTLAIAETGTIVLQNVSGQGRRAVSLVPDYHLCLVDAARVKGTVPDAIAALDATSTLPTTFISGPSATADIEMTRIKGVHGPRFLDVIVFSEGA